MNTNDDRAPARLWQQQPEKTEDPMTIDTIRAHAEAFDRRSRRQDLGAIAAFSFIVVANAIAFFFQTSAAEQLGDLLTILASLYCLSYYWRARAASPADIGATPSVELYRQKILRRQAMNGRFWKVVLLFAPGILLKIVGGAFDAPWPPQRIAAVVVGFAGWVVVIEWLNRRETRRLAAELGRIEG